MRNIFRQNTTRRAIVARPRKDICRPNMTCCAKVTQRKRRRFQSSQTGTAEESDQKPFYERNPKQMDSQMETADAPGRHQGNQESRLRGLGSKWEFNKTLRRGNGLEIAKKINTSPVLLQRSKHWTLWRGRPPPKRKKRLQAEDEPITQKYRPP
jgi:hypothetical protein